MLKWLAGGGGSSNGAGSGNGSSQVGKVFHVNDHQVVVEDTLAEGQPHTHTHTHILVPEQH